MTALPFHPQDLIVWQRTDGPVLATVISYNTQHKTFQLQVAGWVGKRWEPYQAGTMKLLQDYCPDPAARAAVADRLRDLKDIPASLRPFIHEG
jgi:hypothetical protein